MNSTYVLYIVAIVMIILIIYLVAVIFRKKNDKKIQVLESKLELLKAKNLDQAVEEIRLQALIGHSLENFEKWSKQWQQFSGETLPKLTGRLEEVQNFNDTFNFLKVNPELEELIQILSETESNVEAIQEGLEILLEQEARNEKRVTYALDLFATLESTIEIREHALGPCLPEIQQQVNTIRSEFSEFVNLNNGDPVEAAEVLERAEEHTIALGQITEAIPEVVTELTENLPDQLDDLETGYGKFLEANFHFGEQNIESHFQKIRESLAEATDNLAKLELDKAEEAGQDIQEQIDGLYELFERESKAQRHVMKVIKLIPKYLKHNQDHQEQLVAELKRLNKHYILPENLSQTIKVLDKELAKIEEDVVPTTQEDQLPEQAFTALQKVYDSALSNLERIEQDQLDLVEQFQTVGKTEVKSRKLLDDYTNRLHVIKRHMEKRPLPGIPQDFMSIFFTTSSQLEALMAEFSRSRLDIQVIEKLTSSATKAMALLEETTYQVIQNATLTEQLLQYSNRYRSQEPSVQQSFDNALYLFEVNNDYQGAFDEISYALEVVEPGVTERFVNSYEKTREIIRF